VDPKERMRAGPKSNLLLFGLAVVNVCSTFKG
jgi:hypothetical protein